MKRFAALLIALAVLAGWAWVPESGAATQIYMLYYADSLAAGGTVTTAGVPCTGASSVNFYYGHADTSGAACGGAQDCRAFYADSISSGGVQFSNDGSNWGSGQSVGTITLAGGYVIGDGFTDVSWTVVPAARAGGTAIVGGPRATCFATDLGAATVTQNKRSTARFARITFTVVSRGRLASGGCAACAATYKPFVYAVVTTPDNAYPPTTLSRAEKPY